MADPAELAVQAVVGLAAAGLGVGATMWATTKSLKGAAEIDRQQRRIQAAEQRQSVLETVVGEMELGGSLLKDGRFETDSGYVGLPHRAMDSLLEYMHTLPPPVADAVRQAALKVAVYSSYAAASLQPGGKVARAVAQSVASEAAAAMSRAAGELRTYLDSDQPSPEQEAT
jgi:hypothetical protein